MNKIAIVSSIIGTTIGLATLATGVWQYRRKIHLEIFRTYADRYNAILPPEFYSVWHEALQGRRERWAEATPIMIKYLNLVWEEYFLSQQRLIPRRLWRLWSPEIDVVLSTEFARETMKVYNFQFPRDLTQ